MDRLFLMLIAQQDILEREGAQVLMRSGWMAFGEQQLSNWSLQWEPLVPAGTEPWGCLRIPQAQGGYENRLSYHAPEGWVIFGVTLVLI